MERPPAPGPPTAPLPRREVVRQVPEDPQLDGIRGWLAEVDRKLGIRTAIGLALVAACLGASAAAIYLALDDEDKDKVGASRVSVNRVRDDVEALREKLSEAREDVTRARNAARAAQAEASSTRSEIADLATAIAQIEAAEAADAAAPDGAARPGGSNRGD